MKKKVSFILIIVGIIMIIVALLFPSIFTKDNSKDNIVSLFSSGELTTDYQLYDPNNYYTEYFNSIDGSLNKYSFLVPSNEVLRKISNYITEYNGEINIRYLDVDFSNEKTYLNNLIEEYKTEYDKLDIKKRKLDSSTFVIITKGLNSKNNLYIEELSFYSHNDEDNYSVVTYLIQNRTLSNNFIEKTINGFKKISSAASYTTCVENDNQYECSIHISSINKKINYIVDSKKYALSKEFVYDNYREKFVIKDDNGKYNEENSDLVYIDLILSDVLDDDIVNVELYKGLAEESIVLNEKTAKKYVDSEHGMTYYVIKLDSNIAIELNIQSANSDDIAKDFVSYELSNIKA